MTKIGVRPSETVVFWDGGKSKTRLQLYPEYKDYIHHLGLASFYITDTVKEEALSNNVIVLQRKGDLIETFLPKS